MEPDTVGWSLLEPSMVQTFRGSSGSNMRALVHAALEGF